MKVLAKEMDLIINNITKKLIENFEDKVKTKNTSLIILIKSSIEILNKFLKEIINLYIRVLDQII